MSQTETILLIVLGFSLASLIALFLGRLTWAAAVRVGARRMQRQVPSSLIGLQTERDRLRAEYAMLSQRLGTRLETAKLQMAEQMAEVSRHRNRIQEIESSEASRNEELKRLKGQVKELEQSIAEANAREEELRRTLAAREESLRNARRRRTETVQGTAAPAPASSAPPSDDPETRLRQRIEKLTELARASRENEDDSVIMAGPPPIPDDPLIAEKLTEVERQTADLERELERLDSEWNDRLHGRADATPPPPEPAEDLDENVISLSNRIRDLKKSLGSS